jgi:co-chaperonin GroES (HSP10)
MEDKVRFKPLGEKILVEVHSAEEEVNGIYVGSQDNRKGTVVSTNNCVQLEVGDVVLFSNSAGINLSIGNVPYLLLRVDEIFGIDTPE